MNKLTIVFLIGVLSLSNATTCGDAAWWTDIQSNLISKWNTNDQGVKDFNTLRAAYNTLSATTVTASHEVTKGHCASYFTVDQDKSCCSSADHKKLINLAVRSSIAAAVPEGRGDACQALKHNFQKAAESCRSAAGSGKSSGVASGSVIRSTSSGIGSGIGGSSGSISSGLSGSSIQLSSGNSPGIGSLSSFGSLLSSGSGMGSSLGSGSLSGSGSSSGSGSGLGSQSGSGSQKLGSGSVSGLSSGSPSGSVPQSVQKLLDKAEKLGNKAEAQSRKALGDAAKVVAQQLRGTLCAICGDPDAKSSIFDPATGTWYANQAAMDDYIAKFAQALNNTSSNGKDCLDFVQYNQKRFQNTIGSCAAAAKVITDYQAKLTPCTSDAECTQTVAACYNPLTFGCVTSITNDVSDSTSRRALTREQRRVLAPKYQATATGGAGLAANQSEDDALIVGGQDLKSIQQDAATADSDYSATGGGKVDYDQALAAEMSNSNILNIIGLLLIIFAYTF